ncbi:MAG: alpha/beta fold hydrolase [Polyangiaceae bacterium]
MTPLLRERAVSFGARQGLAGILSTPRTAHSGAPFVVLVNAGVVHRVGPNRLYVDIARGLAARGYTVLRFDLRGLGDAEPLTGASSLTNEAVADIKTAFDFLEATQGAKSFICCGLCSGANYSMLTAFSEPRVVGVALVDPTVTRTRRGKLLHYGRRLLHAATWGALLTLRHPLWRRALGRTRGMAVAQAAQGQSEQQEPAQMSTARAHTAIEQLLERGVQLMLVFTGGVNHAYNYRDQLFDLLPGLDFRDQLQLVFMPETDHTVGDVPSRSKLVRELGDWMMRCFPTSSDLAKAGQ